MQMSRWTSERALQACDTRPLAREARLRHPPARDAPSRSRDRHIGPLHDGDLRSIATCELAMNASCPFRGGIVGHEERNLMPVVEIVDVQAHAPFRKREHSQSLSRMDLQTENPRDADLYHIVPLSPNSWLCELLLDGMPTLADNSLCFSDWQSVFSMGRRASAFRRPRASWRIWRQPRRSVRVVFCG
jgi:hypothetical protein